MKLINTEACSLLFFMVFAVSANAAAGENAIKFSGNVASSTCHLTRNSVRQVSLNPVALADIEKLTMGKSTATGAVSFTLTADCDAADSGKNVIMTVTGDRSTIGTILENNKNADSGIGFEISQNDIPIEIGVPKDISSQLASAGKNKLVYTVKYARYGSRLQAGSVASTATFSCTNR